METIGNIEGHCSPQLSTLLLTKGYTGGGIVHAWTGTYISFSGIKHWFREAHKIVITEQLNEITGMYFSYIYKWEKIKKDHKGHHENGEWWIRKNMAQSFQHLPECLENAITEALKLI